MVPYNENAANLQYNTEQLIFKCDLPFEGQMVTKDVTLTYPILEGIDALSYVVSTDVGTTKVESVRLLRALLLHGCTLV